MNLLDRITNKFWRTFFHPKARIRISSSSFDVPRFVLNNFYKSSYKSEKWLFELFYVIHSFRPIGNFIDVGINIGQTLLKIKAVNSEVNYVGVEPNPFCCTLVHQIIKENDMKNCSVVPIGLSDSMTMLTLRINTQIGQLDSTASIVSGYRPEKENDAFGQIVAVMPLDDFWAQLHMDSVDLIKMDIEGGELEAFKGMLNTISKFRPWLIMEVLPPYKASNEFRMHRQNELRKLITEAGYSLFQILSKDGKLNFVHRESFPIHGNINECDYLLLPTSKESDRFIFTVQ